MPGLEPIAALSLACNILQVIGVGRETVRIAKQVYQDGALDPALTEHANVLDALSKEIHSTTTAVPAAKSKAQNQRLIDLAHKCQGAASNLTEEVKFLNGAPNQAKLVATLKTAAKTTWRKRRLERLDKDLKDGETLLQTGLLTAIYEQSLATNDTLVSLGADLRSFIDEYRAGNTSTTDLLKSIATESRRREEAVKSHITRVSSNTEAALRTHIDVAFRGIADRAKDAKLDARGERLLRSLKFDRMNERRNTVSPAHSDTLAWLFRDGSDMDGSRNEDEASGTASWDSFSDWLRSTGTIYWVSGKPGSGKTILMKYILAQTQTKAYLDEWAPDAILVSHFFWRPGTKMQQSIRGLLCSLLHQLLSGSSTAVSLVLGSSDAMAIKDSETDWSEEELRSVLFSVMSCYPKPIALCLDGLDEVLPRDGVLQLLALIDQLKDTGKVKMCLGSRREPLLLRRLGVYPQLRLDQLNRKDLLQYCRAHVAIPPEYRINMPFTFRIFHQNSIWNQERPTNRESLQAWITDSLVHKAEGVFLWLCLTTAKVMSSIHLGDTVEVLAHQIDTFPEELTDLYSDMWARANKDKHQKVRAASFLQLALLQDAAIHLLGMMVATTPGMTDILFASGAPIQISAERLVEACEETMRETTVRCAGLLIHSEPAEPADIQHYFIPWYGEEYRRLLPYISPGAVYSFLHRTARDFLTDTGTGKAILSWGSCSGDSAWLKRNEAHLAEFKLFNRPVWASRDRMPRWSFINLILRGFVSQYAPTRPGNGEHTEADVARLLHLLEHLFNGGYVAPRSISPHPLLPRKKVQGVQGPFVLEVAYAQPTVNRQHQFLLEVASTNGIHGSIWNHILNISKQRNMDEFNTQKFLVQACEFDKFDMRDLKIRLGCIQTLLSRGASSASSCDRTWSQDRLDCYDPLIMSRETPFKALMQSVWGIMVDSLASHKLEHAQDLLRIVCLCINQGADLHEEVHTTLTILVDGKMRLGRILMRSNHMPLRRQQKHDGLTALIVAYPASAILAKLSQLGQLTNLPQDDWVSKITEVGFAGGRPIAIVTLDRFFHRSSEGSFWDCLEMLHAADIHPLVSETGAGDAFSRCVRVAEEAFQGVDSEIPISLELEADVVSAFDRLKNGNVPLEERRREVRMKLGIETELERPEWRPPPLWAL